MAEYFKLSDRSKNRKLSCDSTGSLLDVSLSESQSVQDKLLSIANSTPRASHVSFTANTSNQSGQGGNFNRNQSRGNNRGYQQGLSELHNLQDNNKLIGNRGGNSNYPSNGSSTRSYANQWQISWASDDYISHSEHEGDYNAKCNGCWRYPSQFRDPALRGQNANHVVLRIDLYMNNRENRDGCPWHVVQSRLRRYHIGNPQYDAREAESKTDVTVIGFDNIHTCMKFVFFNTDIISRNRCPWYWLSLTPIIREGIALASNELCHDWVAVCPDKESIEAAFWKMEQYIFENNTEQMKRLIFSDLDDIREAVEDTKRRVGDTLREFFVNQRHSMYSLNQKICVLRSDAKIFDSTQSQKDNNKNHEHYYDVYNNRFYPIPEQGDPDAFPRDYMHHDGLRAMQREVMLEKRFLQSPLDAF